MIACSVVDFPAPFGPMSPTISPGATVEREPANGRDAAVGDLDVRSSSTLTPARLVHRRLAEVRGRDVEVAADLARRALGERPALVEHLDAVADVHDQRHVVIDEEHAGVVLVAHRAHDLGERRHLRLGETGGGLVHEHEARLGRERTRDAEPTLVSVRKRAGRRIRVPRRAEATRGAPSARRRASRGLAPTPSAATSTFSRTESPRNERLCWNVRDEARPPAPMRPPARDVAPLELDRALVGEVEAGEDVHERRLPGPVRPDEPDDLVPMELERDVAKRLHALERTRDAGGPERGSGPPCLLRLALSDKPPRSSGRPWP